MEPKLIESREEFEIEVGDALMDVVLSNRLEKSDREDVDNLAREVTDLMVKQGYIRFQ